MNSPSPMPLRRDVFTGVAFALAVLLMVAPTEADILLPICLRREFGLAVVLGAGFFGVVGAPFLMAVRRRRREPNVWAGRGFLIATGLILVVNGMWLGCIIISRFRR